MSMWLIGWWWAGDKGWAWGGQVGDDGWAWGRQVGDDGCGVEWCSPARGAASRGRLNIFWKNRMLLGKEKFQHLHSWFHSFIQRKETCISQYSKLQLIERPYYSRMRLFSWIRRKSTFYNIKNLVWIVNALNVVCHKIAVIKLTWKKLLGQKLFGLHAKI